MAKCIGLAHPFPSPPLHSVLYAPECPFNLIFISKITRILNCSITFSDKFVILQDRSLGKTIGRGRESQGLYHLTSPSSPAAGISTDAPLLIHSRLGHPNLSKFQKMVSRFSTLSSLTCESCQLGKHTRVSIPKRLNNRAKSLFELVHTDIWGPCRTTSTLRFQYFVTFIDNYSRCTWLFLMKNRAKLFSIFQKFYAEIQTQFNVSIRVLRSDNAREYFSTPFTSFMSQCGILHRSSCAHTPQQNGVAERKNRHLVEIARTLLHHSHVPFHFWGDAVLTACYLINRMPSSILHDQIPHSLIFPTQPLYFIPPCVFGYTCFAHTLTPGHDKLSAKAYKMHLLGILSTSEGLLLLFPDTHRYFHSADVTFFEDSSFFLSFESLPISEVLPLPYISPLPMRSLVLFRFIIVDIVLLLFLSLPLSTSEALFHPRWRQTMVDEMAALHSNDTWDLVSFTSWLYLDYGCDYGDTFSPVAKIAFVHLFLSMAAMWGVWFSVQVTPLSIWLETVSSAWFGRFSLVVQEFGMLRSEADHSVFYHHNSSSQCIYLVVYVDDIVITGSDQEGIQRLKQHLFNHFQTKDLGKLKYFLGLEIAQSSSGVVMSQRKYALDILEETGMLECKPVDTPMDPNVKLVLGQGEPLRDPGRYQRLVSKLNYLTIIRPDISFPMSVEHQAKVCCMKTGYTQIVGYTDADWAGSPSGLNKRTKHIEVDCHFIREKIASGCVATSFVNSNDQLANIFTKSLRGLRIKYICNKLGAYDIYAPT
ncbi:Retrovirus-related Pol polyprotein from transposon TNT 1-94 [Vitis vinifera]|uniref:Retrovirus-related Pol polyprotein from transposon TNT 1-94 n=1 Tax=Vitis vinifera TaxID=29760 RepID=A0A438GJG0_VITVI|nr:Retrovirus-related Pol polyprotein from transposon TNT 1-94 [Vitis vinifera]